MRIDELIGTKRHIHRSFSDVLRDFQQAGGQVVGAGTHAQVIWHPSWNYVFKMFVKDNEYLRFVRFAKRHQDNASFPRILGGPWRIVPFYSRPASEPYLYVVKTEKLKQISDPELRENIDRYVHSGWQVVERDGPEADAGVAAYREGAAALAAATDPKARRVARDRLLDVMEWRHLSDMREMWDRYPTLKELCIAFRMVMLANLGADDQHKGNYMQREDGTLVMIDPVWAGESFWQYHDRLMKAETSLGDDDPEPPNEYNSIPGRKLRPKRRPRPVLTFPPEMDLPF